MTRHVLTDSMRPSANPIRTLAPRPIILAAGFGSFFWNGVRSRLLPTRASGDPSFPNRRSGHPDLSSVLAMARCLDVRAASELKQDGLDSCRKEFDVDESSFGG